jgi:hypothetical protein
VPAVIDHFDHLVLTIFNVEACYVRDPDLNLIEIAETTA